jgi:hypothetical protein
MVEDAKRVLTKINCECDESQFSDLLQMANTIAKYTNSSSFITNTPHLEGREVFGSMKQKANIALGLKKDSHKHDFVNFF